MSLTKCPCSHLRPCINRPFIAYGPKMPLSIHLGENIHCYVYQILRLIILGRRHRSLRTDLHIWRPNSHLQELGERRPGREDHGERRAAAKRPCACNLRGRIQALGVQPGPVLPAMRAGRHPGGPSECVRRGAEHQRLLAPGSLHCGLGAGLRACASGNHRAVRCLTPTPIISISCFEHIVHLREIFTKNS